MFKQYGKRGSWNDFYINYSDEELIEKERGKLIHKLIKAPKSVKIIDAGAGFGKTIKVLNENGYKNVEGIDTSKELIERAKRMGVKVREGRIQRLPYDDNTFDIYINIGVLEHSGEKDQILALQEAKRVLKGGGRAYFCVPFMNKTRRIILPLMRIFNWLRKTNGELFHQFIYDEQDLHRIFAIAGFEIEKIHPNNKVHVIVETKAV